MKAPVAKKPNPLVAVWEAMGDTLKRALSAHDRITGHDERIAGQDTRLASIEQRLAALEAERNR